MDETVVMSGQPDEAGSRRAQLARRVWDDSVYAVVAFPLSLLAFVVVLIGMVVGLSLSWMVAGLPVLVLTAYIARGFAHLERQRLRDLQGREAPSPQYLQPDSQGSWLQKLLTTLRDPQSWLDMVWSLVGFVTGLFSSMLVICWWALVAGGLSYWFWDRWLPDGPDDQGLAELIGLGDGSGPAIALNTVLGIVALLLAPAVTRCAALAHASLADVMLCSRASLQYEVRRATGSRDSARAAEAASMRRLERDIHDGPQQSLVRLAMDLGRARQQLDDDPARARETLDLAYGQARGAIDELRALSRGIAPPLLSDRGLEAALAELVARYDREQVTLQVEPPHALQGLPSHVETCVYFVVAEAMTNVAKHSQAEQVTIEVTRPDGLVDVKVIDDGLGGAHPGKGTGLAGLATRVEGMGGTLTVSSPSGGPTVIAMELPVTG